MAAGKAAASGGGLDRRRNQPGRQNGEETGHNSNGHRAHPVRGPPGPKFTYFASSANSRAAVKKALICDIHHIAGAAALLVL